MTVSISTFAFDGSTDTNTYWKILNPLSIENGVATGSISILYVVDVDSHRDEQFLFVYLYRTVAYEFAFQ